MFGFVTIVTLSLVNRPLHGLTGSVVGHRCIAPGFRPWPGYVRRVFHLLLRLITIGGHWAHSAYRVHKSGRKTSTSTFYLVPWSCFLWSPLLTCHWFYNVLLFLPKTNCISCLIFQCFILICCYIHLNHKRRSPTANILFTSCWFWSSFFFLFEGLTK